MECGTGSAESSHEKISNISGNMLQLSAAMEETIASVQDMDGAVELITNSVREMDKQVEEGTNLADSINENASALVVQTKAKSDEVERKADQIEKTLKAKLEESQ